MIYLAGTLNKFDDSANAMIQFDTPRSLFTRICTTNAKKVLHGRYVVFSK